MQAKWQSDVQEHKAQKGPAEAEYGSEGVVINKYTLSQSHHWSRSPETAVPITVRHDNSDSTNEETTSPRNHVVWSVQNSTT